MNHNFPLRIPVLIGAVFIGASWANSAHAACSRAFDGEWSDHGNSQGQYYYSSFTNDNRNNKVETESITGTRPPLDNSGKPSGVGEIFSIWYTNKGIKNLKAISVNGNTCDLHFAKPYVFTDKFGASKGVLSRRARLTVNGRSMRWCWLEKGHQLGDCIRMRKR